MIEKLKNAIKWGRTSRVDTSDSESEQVLQVETIGGKPKPVYIVLPYGYSANIPSDSTVVMLSPGGSGQDQAGIPTRPEDRFRGLKEWEVKVGNFNTKSNIHYDKDGNIRINPTSTQSEDYAVHFTSLKIAFNELQDKFNAVVNVLSTWSVLAQDGGAALQTAINLLPDAESSADIDTVKVEKVRLP